MDRRSEVRQWRSNRRRGYKRSSGVIFMKQRNGWLVTERRVTFLCRWLEITLEATTAWVIAVPMILHQSRGSCQGELLAQMPEQELTQGKAWPQDILYSFISPSTLFTLRHHQFYRLTCSSLCSLTPSAYVHSHLYRQHHPRESRWTYP